MSHRLTIAMLVALGLALAYAGAPLAMKAVTTKKVGVKIGSTRFLRTARKVTSRNKDERSLSLSRTIAGRTRAENRKLIDTITDEQLIEIFESVRSTDILDLLPDGPDVYTGPRADIETALETVKRHPAVIRRTLKKYDIPFDQLWALATTPEPVNTTKNWHLERAGGLYKNLRAKAEDLAAKFPSLVKMEVLPGSSVSSASGQPDGRPQFVMTLTGSNVTTAGPKKIIYVQGGMHGDEIAGPEYMLRFIEWAATNYGKDSTRILDTTEFVIVPTVNPDGLNAQTRVNANGTDLNRHFDKVHFGGPGSGKRKGSWNYHGKSARSEPEAKSIEALVRSILARQGKAPLLFLDFHEYSGNVLHPWAWTNNYKNDPVQVELAKRIADAAGYTPTQTAAYGLSAGDVTDWAAGELADELGINIRAYCVEIGKSTVPPFRERDERIDHDVIPMFKFVGSLDAIP